MKKYWKSIVFCLCIVVAIVFGIKSCNIETPEEAIENNKVISEVSEDVEVSEGVEENSSIAENKEELKDNEEEIVKESEKVIESAKEADSIQASEKSDGESSTSSNPAPVEIKDQHKDTKKQLKCTLSISCETILNNKKDLEKEKVNYVPKNGIIYGEKTVVFNEGESVFDVLLRETKNNRIHMSFRMTPMYSSNYIEGINNLYEFDCGRLSGWMYNVNGWYPNYGCSRYQVKNGDKIQWKYTCDLGRDLGQYWVEDPQ